MSLQIPFGIQPMNPVPVDTWSGPYIGTDIQTTIDLANSQVPAEIRFQSMEIRLVINNISFKYWYRDGINDNDLVLFNTSTPSLQETIDVLVAKQISQHQKPLVIINTNNFYGPTIEQMNKMIEQNFAPKDNDKLLFVASTPQQALEYIENYKLH